MLTGARARPILLIALFVVPGTIAAQVVSRETTLRATLTDKRVVEGQLVWSDAAAIGLRTTRTGMENTVQRRDISSVLRRVGHAGSGAKTGAAVGCGVLGLVGALSAAGPEMGLVGGVIGAAGGAVVGATIGSMRHSWVPVATTVSLRVRR